MRYASINDETPAYYDNACPLYQAGITKPDVLSFWQQQVFDLQLESWDSNCDLCFQKGLSQQLHTLRNEPERGQWWADCEGAANATFTKGRRLRDVAHRARTQTLIPLEVLQNAPSISCFCGD